MGDPRPVWLVGQAPGRYHIRTPGTPRTDSAGRSLALYPNPPNCTGARLHRAMGCSLSVYIKHLRRTNLIDHWPGCTGSGDRFPRGAARVAAEHLVPRLLEPPAVVLFVGKQVWDVVEGLGHNTWKAPMCWWVEQLDGGQWAWVPHLSGRNRMYNRPEVRAEVAEFLGEFGSWCDRRFHGIT